MDGRFMGALGGLAVGAIVGAGTGIVGGIFGGIAGFWLFVVIGGALGWYVSTDLIKLFNKLRGGAK